MRALRKLNNNVVVCIDGSGREVIAMGKGLGFGEMPREIPLGEIERTFYNVGEKDLNIMRDLPTNVIVFAARVFDIVSNVISYEFTPNAVLLLADHIAFAMERTKKHLHIHMPLAYDVQQMYPQEYQIGLYVVSRIHKEFRIELPRSEAAGIAINLINAKAGPKVKTEQDGADKFAEMLEDVTEIVENYFRIMVDRNSFNFSRYATHLQYLFQRLHSQQTIDSENLLLYKNLRDQFPDISDCVEQISAHIKKKWKFTLSEEEKLYLILHINRICAKEGL